MSLNITNKTEHNFTTTKNWRVQISAKTSVVAYLSYINSDHFAKQQFENDLVIHEPLAVQLRTQHVIKKKKKTVYKTSHEEALNTILCVILCVFK